MKLEEMSPPELLKLLESPLAGDALQDRIRAMLGQTTGARPVPVGAAQVRPTRKEADEQRDGVALLRAEGWRVWRIGQRDARGTQDPGVPDVVAIHPQHGLLWWEAKGKGGRQRPEQAEFQRCCDEVGVTYVLGGRETLRLALEVPAHNSTCVGQGR